MVFPAGLLMAAMSIAALEAPDATTTTPATAGQEQVEERQEAPKPVDVNRAGSEELQKVPGIGPTMAQRIIEWRERNGRFERLEDLLNVRGIGVRTLEKLRPYLEVRPDDPGP